MHLINCIIPHFHIVIMYVLLFAVIMLLTTVAVKGHHCPLILVIIAVLSLAMINTGTGHKLSKNNRKVKVSNR